MMNVAHNIHIFFPNTLILVSKYGSLAHEEDLRLCFRQSLTLEKRPLPVLDLVSGLCVLRGD